MSRQAAPDTAAPTPRGRGRRTTVLAAGVAAALALAVAVTLLLDGRRSSAERDLHEDLQRVATAQVAWKDDHGTYSASLLDLRVSARTDVAIVSAGPDTFCAGAYDEPTRTALFFSPTRGFGSTACR
ncbi:hypothetical protein AB2L28_12050 [Kineococcus sp. TBRC 1896]|uniref:Uncharacterized protein n=1 Tax=Kineococcus mangrovi TaxID=1660183 RepID=A0ABV4I2Q4_9ACTN